MHVSLSLHRVESSRVWNVCGFSRMRTLNSTLHLLFFVVRTRESLVVICDHWSFRATPKQEKEYNTCFASTSHGTKAWSDRGESVTTGEAFLLRPPQRILSRREGEYDGKKKKKARHAHIDYGVFFCGGHGVPGIPDRRPSYTVYTVYIRVYTVRIHEIKH